MHRKYVKLSSIFLAMKIIFFQLTPQVVYTFKVVGIDDKNRSSETQNFTITYKGGELKAQQAHVSGSSTNPFEF